MAKLKYKNKVEQKFTGGNLRSGPQNHGLRTIQVEDRSTASLPTDLNSFYTRFESDNTIQLKEIKPTLKSSTLSFTFSTVALRHYVQQLKGCSRSCSRVLWTIAQSLNCGNNPVIPIPKKNKTKSLNNLWPASLTSESQREEFKTSHDQSN